MSAQELLLRNREVEAHFSEVGGSLSSLRYRGKLLTVPGQRSFTEQILALNQDGAQVRELFRTLEFTPAPAAGGASLTFTTQGVAAFDWLKLRKTYTLAAEGALLTVTYRLENLDREPHAAGLWIQTFLRRSEEVGITTNTVFQPRPEGLAELVHPGSNVRADEWVIAPTHRWLAVMGNDDRTGAMLRFPPRLVSAYYSWFGLSRNLSTVEGFIRELSIPPGGSREFSLELECSGDIPSLLQKYQGEADMITETEGQEILLPKSYSGQIPEVSLLTPSSGVMPRSEAYFDVSGVRQYNQSIQSVILPAGHDPAHIAVFNLRNGVSDYEQPVPYMLQRTANEDWELLFLIPGCAPKGYYYTDIKDGRAYDKSNPKKVIELGRSTFAYRVEFDCRNPHPQEPARFAGGENLLHNGSFELKDPNKDWPEGFFWSSQTAPVRKNVHWVKSDLPGNGFCMLAQGREAPHRGGFSAFFLLDPGRKYTASALVKSDNPTTAYALFLLEFYDHDGKYMPEHKTYILSGKDSYDWKEASRTFFTPENAAVARLGFQTYAMEEQRLYIDNLKVTAEPITFIPKSKYDVLRDKLLNSAYAPLEYLERLSHETVSPHEKWFKPAAFVLPEILYLCQIGNTQECTDKRQIIELAQRLDLNYRFLPLLRKITNQRGYFGVLNPEYAPELEEYTLYQLENLPATPKLVIVQRIDFATQVQQRFVACLRQLQEQSAGILFLDCLNIPAELLGQKQPLPAGFLQVPAMRKTTAAADARICSVYQNGPARVACFTQGSSWYYLTNLRYFKALPENPDSTDCPAYYSRDFPYWEYLYLPMIKSLRWLAGQEPAAAFSGSSEETVIISAAERQNLRLKAVVKNLQRGIQSVQELPLDLQAGENNVSLDTSSWPGGAHVVEMQLLQSDGRIVDAAAVRVDTPETCLIPPLALPVPDRCFPLGQPLAFSLEIPVSEEQDTTVLCRVEDSDGRIVFQQERPAAPSQHAYTVPLQAPFTTLYRIFIQVLRGGRVLAERMEEVSRPAPQLDLTEVHGYFWGGNRETSKLLRDLGFDFLSIGWPQDNLSSGYIRNIANLNLYPSSIGSGDTLYKTSRTYRADAATDPVREPCFSDPERQERVREFILERVAKQQYKYYNCTHHFLGDEQFLGSTVCYSQHCLSAFRLELQKQYADLNHLNREWKREFKTWDEVTPVQLSELSDKTALAPWLDHKMFMAGVFAHQWLGKIRGYLREAIPGSTAGLSGTQIPGYSYDWTQLMQHIDFLAYYSGVQTKLVHDFAPPGFVSGQWGGGYVEIHVPREPYQKANQWSNLFQGANMMPNWHGSALNGDLTPTPNLKFYSDNLLELKRGIGKLVLSAPLVQPQVALLFSQPSLFAAMGTFGGNEWQSSQTAWNALLKDLKIDFKFIPYQEFARAIPEVKVVILPAAIALSEPQRQNLEAFMQAGGTVIADFAPGHYNEHGTLQAVAAGEIRPRATDLELAADARLGIPAVAGRFQVALPGEAVMQVKTVGKGRMITFNFLISAYQTVSLGGVGGETSTVKTGAEQLCQNLRTLVGGILNSSAVTPNCSIVDEQGKLFPCTTMLRSSGKNQVFGILQFDGSAKQNYIGKPESGRLVTVTLPVSGHIYDARNGKYVGQGNQFSTRVVTDLAQVFAILQDQAEVMKMDLEPVVAPGGTQRVRLRSGTGQQVFRLEVVHPDGSVLPWYSRNLLARDGQAEWSFQLAFNDLSRQGQYPLPGDQPAAAAPGTPWRIRASNVATGARSEKTFLLQ
ncbi:MAG: hypothetical protein GX564_12540 [Oligosphaeraceae bacterium]|nr:hypothetical protein [Oligosphaeraceae bacterium]